MDVITLGNHVVRKALILSLNEMAVLCDIVKMSNSPKYNFTCRKSKEKIADWLDLSRQTVHTIINTLKAKGYVINFDEGLRPSELIYEINTASEEIGIYIKNGDIEMISKKISEIIEDLSVKKIDSTVKKLDTGVKNLYSEVSKNFTQDISKKKDKEKINNIPAEENKDNISLLTSDTTMYESKKTNIEFNCTLPINDVIIPVEQKKPKKEVKDPAVMLENRRFSKDFTDAWNAAGKEKLGQIGYVAINKLFAKHGYDKGMFFCHYLCQMQGSNEKSIAKIENQDKAFLFYQDPQEEQPKYLGTKIGSAVERFKNYQEEPSSGVFVNEEYFYAALEQFYSNQFSGTELVKKVRERVKEINCKYNKY